MDTQRQRGLHTMFLSKSTRLLGMALLATAMATPARAIDLADEPLFSTTSAVPGNLILALSVEWPTATTPAYPSTTAYAAASTFLGYFDPGKCYLYKYDSSTPSSSYFAPYGRASSHACSSSASLPLWSGNYLNWASMQTLDAFRWVLTGGYRSTDTATDTILTKTYAERDASVIPQKTLAVGSTDDPIAGATPFKGSVWTSGVTTRVRALGTRMWITSTNTGSTTGTVGTASKDTTGATAYTSQNSYVGSSNDSYAKPGVTYELYINLKVCDASVGLEANCKQYGSNYKPEGLMQAYATKLRYSAFGYLNHSGDTSQQRDGGVMRARMKYIGPTQPVPGSTATSNSAAEWDASTGIMVVNPDTADATATQTLASSAGLSVSIANSGVMNYLNKFGYSAKGYKSKDPVSEMVQAALRYYRNLGNVASYTDLSGAGSSTTAAAWLDGFPAITSWDDPIAYSCQRNFILGIGDVNTHRDANLYGSTLRSGLEPTLPTAVAADTAVNVKTATDMVGQLEGLTGSVPLGGIYAATSSSTCADTSAQCNTYYLAGLAYDAHTRDLRSDLTGTQTVNTYWMDVLEGQVYKHKNQYWLAAKYGGFTLPDGFSPYASSNGTSTLADSSWRSNTDTLTIGTTSLTYSTDSSTSTDVRPDNYFPGDRPDLMKSGLTNAFAKISSELKATTATAFATAAADVASGDASYAAGYDPKNWTGTLTGSRVAYDASGTPTVTPLWNARTLLDARTAAGRVIVTCCDSTGAALPFQAATLAAATLGSRTTYTSFASVSGVSTQSAANYLAYLRGDRTQEAANGGPYRSRSYLLGDIAGGRINPVGAPAAPYYDSYNPGYSSFRKAHAGRKTVVYAGANDGMLHAFDGTVPADSSTACTTCGQELFAYIPSFVYGTSGTAGTAATSGLASLGNPSFTHHFLVDGKPLDFDLDFSKTQGVSSSTPDWRTLLIGGLGKGGSGYYAIDVTDPAAWVSETAVAAKVLWEFTDTRMGYSYGAPIVVKTAKYGWVAIFTSGYNNSDGKGYFFIVNPRTGALLEAVATPEGSTSAPLGMAQASVFVPDFKDFTADAVYAGDQQGNVWRLDLTGTTAYAQPTKIASLVRDSVVQPITTRPLIEIDPASQKRYVLVGTGRLLADSDISSRSVQGFYALVDGTSTSGGFYTSATLPTQYVFPLTRGQLNANTNLLAGIGSSPVSAMGWYYDLATDSTSGIAERIHIDPVANQGIVAFAANLPDGVVCSPSGKTRQFAVSFAGGKSVLVDETGALIGATAYRNGLTTDLAIVRVDGKLRLVAGSSTGEFFPVPGQLVSATGLKRLNWREVPAED